MKWEYYVAYRDGTIDTLLMKADCPDKERLIEGMNLAMTAEADSFDQAKERVLQYEQWLEGKCPEFVPLPLAEFVPEAL